MKIIKLRDLSLRARLIGGPAFAVVVSIAVGLGYMSAFSRQEQVVQEILQRDIARSEQAGLVLVRLSANHRLLSEILTAAVDKKIDEEAIFERGRKIIDALPLISKQLTDLRVLFQGDSELMATFEGIGREIAAYRSTVISVIEMSTADAGRASTEMLKADASYVRLADHTSTMVRLTNSRISAELEGMVSNSARTSWLLLTAGSAALILLFLVSTVLYRDISRTIHTVIRGMSGLANGKLDKQVPNQNRSDEIGAMARSIELFRTREIERCALVAREQAGQTAERERAKALAQIVEDFRAMVLTTVGATTETIAKMHLTSDELTVIASQADQRAQDVARSSDAMSASVSLVAAAAEELDTSLSDINTETSRASRFVGNMTNTAQSASEQVVRLAENANRIGEVTDMIRDVAEQINLLALNATIEAARAGEYGRGFAVVASEVKALAGQASSATTEIAAQITEIQQLIGETVGSVHLISTAVTDVNGFVRGIAATVEGQNATTREIANNSQKTAIGVSELAANMAHVKHAIQMTNDLASAVRQASTGLATQTNTLQSAVNVFLSRVAAA